MSTMKVTRDISTKLLALFGISAFLVALPNFAPGYFTHLLILFFMYLVLAEAWNLLYGYVGLCSFGHSAFFGFGAYFTAFSAMNNVPFPFTIVIGGIAASLLALALSYPLLRLRGAYFAIGMLGLNEILRIYFTNEDTWMHSAWGTTVPIVYYGVAPYYYIILAIMASSLLLLHKIVNSTIGYAFLAIRENETLAETCGINIYKYTTLALIISAFFPGLIGGFYAHYISYFEASDVFNVSLSMSMVVMAIFGGAGSLEGPIIGTGVLFFVGEILRGMFTYGHLIILAIILIVTCLFMPGGIIGVIRGTHPLRVPEAIRNMLYKISAKSD